MSLHFTVGGRGPRLVLLHGWALNARVWESVRPRLEQSFTVVGMDLPGHGPSPFAPGFHDIDSLAQLLEPCLSAEEGGCHLLGWSLGGMAALQLALRRPGLIRRLVLVAATPKFVRDAEWPHGVETQLVDDLDTRMQQDYQATVREFLALQVLGDAHAREALRGLRDSVLAAGEPDPGALSAGLNVLRTTDLRAQLPEIQTPALVMCGERDRLSSPGASTFLAQTLPHATLNLMKRAGHAPFLSHADEFCATLETFLLDLPNKQAEAQ